MQHRPKKLFSAQISIVKIKRETRATEQLSKWQCISKKTERTNLFSTLTGINYRVQWNGQGSSSDSKEWCKRRRIRDDFRSHSGRCTAYSRQPDSKIDASIHACVQYFFSSRHKIRSRPLESARRPSRQGYAGR